MTRVGVARAVGDEVNGNAGDDLVMELVGQQSVEAVS
jgi:hypothetical protein